MNKYARKSDAEKYEKTMKNESKKGARSRQKPSKNKVWKMIDFWIDVSGSGADFFSFFEVPFSP